MARISTYVIDGTIVDDDKVIGSDANNSMITKNYTVRDLAAYIGYSIGNNLLVPYVNASQNVDLGAFNLTANSIIVGNQLILGGTAGLVGQVLMSNGSGSPASWTYNIGSQTLRNVLNQGNTGNKNLILSNTTTSTIALDLEKLYGQNVGLYVFDNLLNSSSALFPNKLDVQESSLQKTASYSASGIRYSNNGFNVDINPNTYANQTLLYPSNSGVLVTSVNGNPADLTGNVTLSGLGLGTVTSVAVTPGTGISASVADASTTPNITITNTAPDQVVILNEGAGIDITGTYPSFTIAATGSGTTPTLQEVLAAGNISENNLNITLYDSAGQNNFVTISPTTGFQYANDLVNGDVAAVNGDRVSISKNLLGSSPKNVELTHLGLYYNFSDPTGTFGYTGNLNYPNYVPDGTITANTIYLPLGDGNLALKVNGVGADVNGEITIPAGTGTVTSVAALTLGTSGTDLNSTVANGTTTPVITLNVPDAALSARGVVTTGTQTFGGSKTFRDNILIQKTSSTSQNITIGFGGGVADFDNLAFGSLALNSSTASSYQNLGIGHYSLQKITNGNSNIGLGNYTLNNLINGQNNTAIGYSALGFSTGSDNTVLGNGAAAFLVSGNNNILIGSGVGNTITSGSNNTIIGKATGLGTSLSDNVIISDGSGNIRFKDDNTNTILPRLAGSGTRMVVAGSNGELTTQTIPSGGGVSGTGTINEIAYFTSTGSTIGSLTTATYPSLTELSYVKGVTSSIQTQIGTKQATITGAATTITSSDLTASRALISNASGKVAVSAVTDTELGYVSGVTSGIQTQIDGKATIATINNNNILGYQALGSTIKGGTLDLSLNRVTTGISLPVAVSGRLFLIPVYIPVATTITGVKFMSSIAGVYTAANYNGFGLYSYNTVTGAGALLASTPDDGTIFKSSANVLVSKAFSSAASVSAGFYYIGMVWSFSGTPTTTPAILGNASMSTSMSLYDFTNSGKLFCHIISQTTLPSSWTHATNTTNNPVIYWVSLY